MTNDELEQQLRRIPVPPRDPDYWQSFPETVTRRIASEAKASTQPATRPASIPAPQSRDGWNRTKWSRTRLNWTALAPAAAAAVVIMAAVVWLNQHQPPPTDPTATGSMAVRSPADNGSADPSSADNPDPRAALLKVYQEVAELFPGRLEAIVLGQEGPQLQLSENADVPASPPVFVRLCDATSRCTTAVSFSGQTVRLDGGDFEVLTSGDDEVFLLTRGRVWTPGTITTEANRDNVAGQWRLEAGWLAGARADRHL